MYIYIDIYVCLFLHALRMGSYTAKKLQDNASAQPLQLSVCVGISLLSKANFLRIQSEKRNTYVCMYMYAKPYFNLHKSEQEHFRLCRITNTLHNCHFQLLQLITQTLFGVR